MVRSCSHRDVSTVFRHCFSDWFSICLLPYLLVFRELPWLLSSNEIGFWEDVRIIELLLNGSSNSSCSLSQPDEFAQLWADECPICEPFFFDFAPCIFGSDVPPLKHMFFLIIGSIRGNGGEVIHHRSNAIEEYRRRKVAGKRFQSARTGSFKPVSSSLLIYCSGCPPKSDCVSIFLPPTQSVPSLIRTKDRVWWEICHSAQVGLWADATQQTLPLPWEQRDRNSYKLTFAPLY